MRDYGLILMALQIGWLVSKSYGRSYMAVAVHLLITLIAVYFIEGRL